MRPRLTVPVLALVLTVCFAAMAAGPLVFNPKPGTEVPYTYETRLSAQLVMAGQPPASMSAIAKGKYVDRVEEASENGERLIGRSFTALAMGESEDAMEDLTESLPPEAIPYVRNARAVLLSAGGQPADQLSPFPLSPGGGQAVIDPIGLSFFQQIVIPYPEQELRLGMQWDPSADLIVAAGIDSVEASAEVVEISGGDPSFAIIQADVHIVGSAVMTAPGPDGEAMDLPISYETQMRIKQWSAVANGLVARAEIEGASTLNVQIMEGMGMTVKIDELKSIVTYDEEAGQ